MRKRKRKKITQVGEIRFKIRGKNKIENKKSNPSCLYKEET